MKDLRIVCVQSDLFWEDKEANLKKFEHWFTQVPKDAHVIVLPEMFSTGFSMNAASLAENMDGNTVQWLRNQAIKQRKIITGSVIIQENGNYFNRLIWMQPDGNYSYYDKRHLFGFAGEDSQYKAGEKRCIVQVNGWKINLQVCYDLRFPVWARQAPFKQNQAPSYDILLYVANWPQRRIMAWDTLLKARAIENQAYVIGVNRVGNDANEIYHDGSSSVIDPWGEVLWNLKEEEGCHLQTFTAAPLLEAREKLPFLKDGDQFIIE